MRPRTSVRSDHLLERLAVDRHEGVPRLESRHAKPAKRGRLPVHSDDPVAGTHARVSPTVSVCVGTPMPDSTTVKRKIGDEEVHDGATRHDDDLAPPGKVIEGASVVLADLGLRGRASVLDQVAHPTAHPQRLDRASGRNHAHEPYVAAQGKRLDAVLGLAALAGPQRRPESDEVLADLDPEALRGNHVADLVERDRHHESDDEEGDPKRAKHASTVSQRGLATWLMRRDVAIALRQAHRREPAPSARRPRPPRARPRPATHTPRRPRARSPRSRGTASGHRRRPRRIARSRH